jgi:hypothetical protein
LIHQQVLARFTVNHQTAFLISSFSGKMNSMLSSFDTRRLYDAFDVAMTDCNCGEKCAVHHPNGIPFCCDICQAVPAVYRPEWEYLQSTSDMWHVWRGNECPQEPVDPVTLEAETPEYMLLLACKGPHLCQRPFRSISCRQFPFFPYITSHDQFLGLAYHWDFEPTCWVISNLGSVSAAYRRAFIDLYEQLFAVWEEDFDSYAITSEDMRAHYAAQKRRIPILHRNGGNYLLSPNSERLQRIKPDQFRRFGPYR